jgi:hypothetical protein
MNQELISLRATAESLATFMTNIVTDIDNGTYTVLKAYCDRDDMEIGDYSILGALTQFISGVSE